MSSKSRWRIVRATLLAVMIITAGTAAFGCVSGVTAIGWSGGTVSDDTLYVGSREGRLVALNLADDSRRWSDPLKAAAQPGLFGCGPSMGGGCGTASSGVAIYGTPVVSGAWYIWPDITEKFMPIRPVRWPRGGSTRARGISSPLWAACLSMMAGCMSAAPMVKVYALDAATGDKLWEFTTGDKIWATPAIRGDTLYIGSFDKKLHAIDINTHKDKWPPFSTNGTIMATPLIHNNVAYFGSFDRHLYAVDANTGRQIWRFPSEEEENIPKNWFWAEPVIVNDTVYAGCLDGKVYVIRADTGEKVATLDLNSPISSKPVVIGDSVIFASRKGVIYSVNTISNQATQIADIKLEVDGPLTAHEGIVYIHTQDVALHRVNAVNGAVLPPVSIKGQD